MKRLVALYRSPTYSPQQHRHNDTAILDETVERLARRGWAVSKTGETDVVAGRLPPAELYVNMCQGAAASERLLRLVPLEALSVNPPASVLNCHRHRLVERMADAGLPFPRTLRGVARVALQAHVPGPILKFYAVADGSFFHWYPADGGQAVVNEERLRALVFAAARALALEVFGGDVAVPQPDAPVLIDINDWPSFAPVRAQAAEAIAAYIDKKASL